VAKFNLFFNLSKPSTLYVRVIHYFVYLSFKRMLSDAYVLTFKMQLVMFSPRFD